MRPLLVAFAGGEVGSWAVERFDTVAGAPLESVSRLEMIESRATHGLAGRPAWVLRGVTSNERYVSRSEHDAFVSYDERQAAAARLAGLRTVQPGI